MKDKLDQIQELTISNEQMNITNTEQKEEIEKLLERIKLLENDSSSSNQQLLEKLRKAEEAEKETKSKLTDLRKDHSILDGEHTKMTREFTHTQERLDILMKQCEADADELGRLRAQKTNLLN